MEKILKGLRKNHFLKGYYIISRKSFLKNISSNSKRAVIKAVYFLLGILISRGSFLNTYYPFGAAYLAAVPQEELWLSLFGTGIGYLMFSGAENSLRYLAICVAAAGIRWALSDLKRISLSEYFPMGNAGFAVGFTGIVLMVTGGIFSTDGLTDILIEGALSSAGAYFLNVFFTSLKDVNKGIFSDKKSIIGFAVSMSMFLLPFAGGTMNEFSFGRSLILLFVILSAYLFGESAGAIAGICACLIFVSGSDEAGYVALAYSVAGLAGGLFSSFGRVASAVSFVAVNAVSALLLSGRSYLAVMTGEATVAGLAFLIIPLYFLNSLRYNPVGNGRYKNSSENYDTVKRMTAAKLQYASTAFSDIGGYIEQVYEKMEGLNFSEKSELCVQTQKDVCAVCSSRSLCNIKHQKDYYNAFLKAEEIFKSGCEISENNVPEFLKEKCVKSNAVINSLNREFLNRASKDEMKRRSNEIRMAVTEQFEGTGRMLGDLSEEISSFADYDSELSKRISDGLKSVGIMAGEVICRKKGENGMTVEIFSCKARAGDVFKGHTGGIMKKGVGILSSEIMKTIEEVTGKTFDTPFVYPEKNGLMFRAATKPNYTLDYGIVQHSRKNGRFCGDSYDFFCDGSGKAMLLISDGMGTGGRAAVDSTMATAVFTRLVKAGIGFDNALDAVNSALMVKSDDESLATIDIASINLFSGKAELLKAGAALGFIVCSGAVSRIECNSLPVGILKNIKFERSEVRLNAGDIVVLISDGAAAFSEYIEKKIKRFRGSSAQDLAEEIMDGILSKLTLEQEDDITVLIGILKNNISNEVGIQKTA